MWGLGVGVEKFLVSCIGDMMRKACSEKLKKLLAAPWNKEENSSLKPFES